MLYLLIFAGISLAAYLIRQWQVAIQTRKELASRIRDLLVEITHAESTFHRYTSHTSGYFDNYKRVNWQGQHKHLFTTIKELPFQSTDLTSLEKSLIGSFLDHYQRANTIREEFNSTFIPEELRQYDQFFSNVEGRSLDVQQRTAIIRNEDNSLIIAGAGSGKTTTIVGKVAYVLKRYHTAPSHVLLISFTNKSAAQLKERVDNPGIVPRTFHKFGKDVICAVEGKQPSLYDENQFKPFIRSCFQELMKEEAYAKLVTTYFLHHLKPAKDPDTFRDQGEYIQHLKDNNFSTYKSVRKLIKNKQTFKREVVKSVEEFHIANFLFLNGVEYEYEAPYEHPTASTSYAQWKPDFTITQGNARLYLEHFGVDREGNVPAFFAKNGESRQKATARYQAKITFARATSKLHGTTLLETYSYEMAENTLFTNLAEHLHNLGITLQTKSPLETWRIIATAAEEEVTSFHTLIQTFITLLKSNNYTLAQVRERAALSKDNRERERNLRFVDIVTPLFNRYQQELLKRKEIDFSDLINQAAHYIQQGQYRQQFDYLIVDEFQDISKGRYHLLQAIIAQNPQCKLFCVGDDWQSIYRFTGSDIALFKEFSQYFGFSISSKIETTYRFHEPLIAQSGKFITRNPNQTPKTLRSIAPHKRTDYQIFYSNSENQDDTEALRNILNKLVEEIPDIQEKEIILLGRYSFDINRIKNTDKIFEIDKTTNTLFYRYPDSQQEYQVLDAQFMTVHKAKGLEADIIIVLNCNSGKYGFPSEMSDDPVLNLLLSEADQFENGEERRLFYVALTRAKERVILLADQTYKSKFITELEVNDSNHQLQKCPICKSADLVKRSGTKNGKQWAFNGCSNYLYGCDYKQWI
jgi:DNA helicase-4